MIVLDSDILSLLVYDEDRTGDDQSVAKRVSQRLSVGGEPAAVSIVTIEEQMRGWLAWIKKQRSIEMQVRGYVRLRRVLELPRRFRVLDFDQSAGKIFEDLRSQRLRIGTMDLKIAAITLANHATLITRNVSDFRRVPGLDVQDWTRDDFS